MTTCKEVQVHDRARHDSQYSGRNLTEVLSGCEESALHRVKSNRGCGNTILMFNIFSTKTGTTLSQFELAPNLAISHDNIHHSITFPLLCLPSGLLSCKALSHKNSACIQCIASLFPFRPAHCISASIVTTLNGLQIRIGPHYIVGRRNYHPFPPIDRTLLLSGYGCVNYVYSNKGHAVSFGLEVGRQRRLTFK